MERVVLIFILILLVFGCSGSKNKPTVVEKQAGVNDTIRIANDKLEYEVIIIEPGFNAWLAQAKPRGYYSQGYLESRNQVWVVEYNYRVLQPTRYNSNLYILQIDYWNHIDYGYEVNYLLYNYLVYFQQKYNQKLGTFRVHN